MSPEKRQRFVFLGLGLLLHVVAFYALGHFIIFSASPPPDAEQVFQMVNIQPPAAAAPSPPPPPPQPPMSEASGGGSKSAAALPIITTPTVMPHFNEPIPTLDHLPNSALFDKLATQGTSDTSTGTDGTGTGAGTGGLVNQDASSHVCVTWEFHE